MKNPAVRILRGIAKSTFHIKEREYIFNGAWNLTIAEEDRHFSIECLVPGEVNSLAGMAGALGDWSKNDYAIRMEGWNDAGNLLIDESITHELLEVLERVKRGEIEPTDVYREKVSPEYVQQVLDFILPRLEYVPKTMEGAGIATRHDLEMSMGRTDVPSLPKA